jgi:hypothetical protein
MFENLPPEINWHIFKFLRHPVAEIFMNQKAYNKYLMTKEDTYENIGGETYQINDLIPFYDVWRIYKRRKYRVVHRIVKMKLE